MMNMSKSLRMHKRLQKNGKRYQLLSVEMLSEELVNHSESIRMHSEALLALKWEKLKLKVTVKFRR